MVTNSIQGRLDHYRPMSATDGEDDATSHVEKLRKRKYEDMVGSPSGWVA